MLAIEGAIVTIHAMGCQRDMVVRNNEYRVCTDHAPVNLTTVKHIAHNLIREAPGDASIRLKRKLAAWMTTSSHASSALDPLTRIPSPASPHRECAPDRRS